MEKIYGSWCLIFLCKENKEDQVWRFYQAFGFRFFDKLSPAFVLSYILLFVFNIHLVTLQMTVCKMKICLCIYIKAKVLCMVLNMKICPCFCRKSNQIQVILITHYDDNGLLLSPLTLSVIWRQNGDSAVLKYLFLWWWWFILEFC